MLNRRSKMSVKVSLAQRSKSMLACGLVSAVLLTVLPQANAHHDENVYKLNRGTTERVSVSSTGQEGDQHSGAGTCGGRRGWMYSASNNGRFVTFASKAGNLHPADKNDKMIQDIFVFDRKEKRTEIVSVMPSGLSPDAPPGVTDGFDLCQAVPAIRSYNPAISGNGRYVAFVSNLPLTGTNDLEAANLLLDKVFVRDLKKGTTELISRTWDGSPGVGVEGSGIRGLTISNDGRFIAFTSDVISITKEVCSPTEAPPFIGGGGGSCLQTYVRDRVLNETTLVSKSSAGIAADFGSESPSISGNGRYVAFHSEASNLVPNDNNLCFQNIQVGPSCSDVFVHDLWKRQTELVSIARDGSHPNGASRLDDWLSAPQAISDDGRFVSFSSFALDLVPANNLADPSHHFVRDRKASRTERVSVSSTGTMLMAFAGAPTLSDTGRYLLSSMSGRPAPYLAHDHGGGSHLVDRKTGQVDWVTTGASDASHHPGDSALLIPSVGGNARFVLGSHDKGFVVGNDTNDAIDVFVRDIGGLQEIGVSHVGLPATRARLIPRLNAYNTSSGWGTYRDAPDDTSIASPVSEILRARVAHRLALRDLYVRVDVERLATADPLTGLLPLPILHTARFEIGDRIFELRVQGWGGPAAQGGGIFGVFDCSEGTCDEISRVPGGYGTIGENFVAAIPLRHLDLERGGTIDRLEFTSGTGTYVSGLELRFDGLRVP
jgi:hypothetical protein